MFPICICSPKPIHPWLPAKRKVVTMIKPSTITYLINLGLKLEAFEFYLMKRVIAMEKLTIKFSQAQTITHMSNASYKNQYI
jgi:hypothetical protein